MNDAIEIKRKELSNGLITILVTLNGQEGMLLSEVARVLGVSRSTIQQTVRNRGLLMISPTNQQIRDLRHNNVVSMKARSSNFLPRATVEAIVKIVDTPEAWTINKQLWAAAHSFYNGELLQAGLDIGLTKEDVKDYIIEANERLKKERDEALAAVSKINSAPLAYAVPKAVTAHEAITLFPGTNYMAQRWFKQKFANKPEKLDKFRSKESRLTYFLKVRHSLDSNIVAAQRIGRITDTGGDITRTLYDREALTKIEELYAQFKGKKL